MSKVYYCYSCSEYFKVKYNVLNQDGVLCPHCESDDTEHSPEEEKDEDEDDTDNFYRANTSNYNLDDDSDELVPEDDTF